MAEGRDTTPQDIHWVDPPLRGILPLDSFHVPRRLRRTIRSDRFDIRCNTAFDRVVSCCADPGWGREDSWINPEIERLYIELHHRRRAHSVEVFRDGGLVGGLFGVSLGAAFFGESMFSRDRDSSKVALVHLVARLRKSGYALLDTQFHSNHLDQFGVEVISRQLYRQKLTDALETSVEFDEELSQSELEAFLQSTIQTS